MIDTKRGNIAILCSGGDVSGMNPALKYFVEHSLANGLKPYFIHRGFEGMIFYKEHGIAFAGIPATIDGK
jgi:6-phosphofructokinase 1